MTLSKTVAVIDYGMGNLRSVSQAVQHVAQGSGVDVIVTSNPAEVMAAERVVLPGQGAIADCMRELAESGLLDSVLHAAAHKPMFGVCVGMQMLLTHSAEGRSGDGGQGTAGLGLIPGEVLKFDLAGQVQADVWGVCGHANAAHAQCRRPARRWWPRHSRAGFDSWRSAEV